MTKRKLTTEELNTHFREQLGALQRSADMFDNGYQVEARRMAVILRVLLHSGRSPSLLQQLSREDTEFVDSSLPFDPSNLGTFHGLISIAMDVATTSYEAKLDRDEHLRMKPFSIWWNATVFVDRHEQEMSRADVVRTASDQDGGAHVDASLRSDYFSLRHENSLGWTTETGKPPTGDAAYAAIRQITHEVLKTFLPDYRKTSEDVRLSRKRTEISNKKLRFSPHETQFVVNDVARPVIPNMVYEVTIKVDIITTGAVMMVVNTAPSARMTSAGLHKMRVIAGPDPYSGVFGEFTDAVIDHVSILETGETGQFDESGPRLVKHR